MRGKFDQMALVRAMTPRRLGTANSSVMFASTEYRIQPLEVEVWHGYIMGVLTAAVLSQYFSLHQVHVHRQAHEKSLDGQFGLGESPAGKYM